MITKGSIGAGILLATLGMAGMAQAVPFLTITNTDPAREEHTGDPGGSVYPSANGSVPGPGVPWQSPSGGWPSGPGISADASFPPNSGTSGWYGAYLSLSEAGSLTFQYMGKGNSTLANRFEVFTGGAWTSIFDGSTGPCGAAGPAPVSPTCTSGVNERTLSFGTSDLLAGVYVPFRFVTGQNVTLTNDGSGNPTNLLTSPGYFLGVDPYLTSAPHTTTGGAIYAGLTDLPAPGDHDFQDFGVRIRVVPEPSSVALLGVAAFGMVVVGRRRV